MDKTLSKVIRQHWNILVRGKLYLLYGADTRLISFTADEWRCVEAGSCEASERKALQRSAAEGGSLCHKATRGRLVYSLLLSLNILLFKFYLFIFFPNLL